MKIVVSRLGAFGDSIFMTPLIYKLKKQGHEVIVHTGSRGEEVLRHDPSIDEIVLYEEDSVPKDQLMDYLDTKAEELGADKHINLTGSIENNLLKHPNDPEYNYSKQERIDLCNKNCYEETFNKADVKFKDKDIQSRLYFTKAEQEQSKSYLRKDSFNILWVLSGSGRNKVYPWTEYVIGEVLNNYKNIHFITVGDHRCKLLELSDESISNLSGEVGIRTSLCLTGLVDLVISPDTGVLHGSGAYTTPKICLIGHGTINHLTKYFDNDYSLEADCPCSPCFRLIYDHSWQCPVDPGTGAAWCQASIKPELVYKQIQKIIPEEYAKYPKQYR